MRLSSMLQLAAAAAIAIGPTTVQAEPMRAAAALPAKAPVSAARAIRTATPTSRTSALVGLPVLALVGVFGTLTFVAIVVSGRGRSPG